MKMNSGCELSLINTNHTFPFTKVENNLLGQTIYKIGQFQ